MTEAVAFKSGCLRSAVLLLKSQLHAINLSALLIFLITVSSPLEKIPKQRSKSSRQPFIPAAEIYPGAVHPGQN